MKKSVISTILLTSSIFANSFIFDTAEEATIQNYIKLDNKVKVTSLNIDQEVYMNEFNKYIEKNKIEKKELPKILKEEKEILNKEFIFSTNTFKYKLFLKQLSYKLPEKEKLNLIKEITQEESEYLMFRKLAEENLKIQCDIVKEERKKELKDYLKRGMKKEFFHSEIKNCLLDNLTVNEKHQLLKKIEKKAFKIFFLEKIYLSKNKTNKELKKELEFYKSSDYQKAYKEKEKIRFKLILNKKNNKTIKKEKVKEVKKEEIFKKKKEKVKMSKKFEGDLEFLND